MGDTCELHRATGSPERRCDQDDCVFWRVNDHLGLIESPVGCAIQYYELLDQRPDIANWLLTVKHRTENVIGEA